MGSRWLSAVLLVSACTLDVRDLDAFRETARGPQKLSAIVHDGSRPAALRAEAALRLLDLERAELDGRALLFEGLSRLSPEERSAFVPTLQRGLLDRMQTSVGVAPDARAVRAKDVAVGLLPMLPPAQRASLGAAVVRWIGADVERRADVGRHTLEQVTAEVGRASAGPMAESVRADLRSKDLSRLSRTVLEHGDADSRARLAAKVVALERTYRGAPDKRAELEEYALPALGELVDTQVARRRLVAIASDRELPTAERARSLALLEGRVSQEDAAPLAQVALDDDAPLDLRTSALARLGETRSPEALKPLLQLVASRQRALRQPAFGYAVEIGGERAVSEILSALPQHWNVSYTKEEIDDYSQHLAELPPTPFLVNTLGRKAYAYFWWQRVLGLRYLAQRANVGEARWRLRLHVEDKKEITGDGWPRPWTVGREAEAGLRVVDERT